MKNRLFLPFWGIIMWLFVSCSHEIEIFSSVDEPSPLVENYAGMVVPPNMAPIKFFVDAQDGQEA